jgi:hypothetical protein
VIVSVESFIFLMPSSKVSITLGSLGVAARVPCITPTEATHAATTAFERSAAVRYLARSGNSSSMCGSSPFSIAPICVVIAFAYCVQERVEPKLDPMASFTACRSSRRSVSEGCAACIFLANACIFAGG